MHENNKPAGVLHPLMLEGEKKKTLLIYIIRPLMSMFNRLC